MYIRKYFARDNFKLVQKMFNNLKREFVITLIRSRWMDKTTKAYALEKVMSAVVST